MRTIVYKYYEGVLPNSEQYNYITDPVQKKILYSVTACGHYYCKPGFQFKQNEKNGLILLFLERGVLNITYRGRQCCASKGNILILDSMFLREYSVDEQVEFYWICFEGANSYELYSYLLGNSESSDNKIFITKEIGTQICDLFSSISNQANDAETEYCATEVSLRLYRILCDLVAEYMSAKKKLSYDLVQDALEYITIHLHDDLTLQKIADELHVSVSSLERIFRSEMKCSIHNYVLKERMKHAQYLLKHTDYQVKDITNKVGYSSISTFSAAFSKQIGVSPMKYRRYVMET